MELQENFAKRQLAFLVLSAGLLILLASWQFITEKRLVTTTAAPVLLTQVNGNLVAVDPEKSGQIEPDSSRAPELTPFFFERVPINRADHALLTTLPGVGSVMAERIIDYRKAHGPITSAEQLKNIQGIGPKRSTQLAGYITFE